MALTFDGDTFSGTPTPDGVGSTFEMFAQWSVDGVGETISAADVNVTHNGVPVITAGVAQAGWTNSTVSDGGSGGLVMNVGVRPDVWTPLRIWNGVAGDFSAPHNTLPALGSFAVTVSSRIAGTISDSYSGNPYSPVTSEPAGSTPNPDILVTSLGALTVGVPVSIEITAATPSGSTPWDWSVVSGALPAGLSITENTLARIIISGTPSSAGAYGFDLQVVRTSGSPVSDTQAFSGSVAVAADPLEITTSTLPGASVGAAYTETVEATGGVEPYAWSLAPGSGPLPPGLTINASTGAITGTPTEPGRWRVRVRCTDDE